MPSKTSYLFKHIYIEKILLLSKEIYSGGKKKKNYKYFIGYLYDVYNVKPLYIMLLEMSAYVKTYDGQTKWMYFLIEDDYL